MFGKPGLKNRSSQCTKRDRERYLTQFSVENPYTNRKCNNELTTQKRHQNFDCTTIADRLRTVSWSNNSHPTGVVKPGLKAFVNLKYCM